MTLQVLPDLPAKINPQWWFPRFYFSWIERFHPERIPRTDPLLFASNHPNSVTDAFIIGASVPRKVNFVATVQLFRWAPVRWLLTRFGVIPINRVKDDPHAMRTVLTTFEACFRVLEQGEAIGIFPEGITHDDPQLKTVETGAARMALELEHRRERWLQRLNLSEEGLAQFSGRVPWIWHSLAWTVLGLALLPVALFLWSDHSISLTWRGMCVADPSRKPAWLAFWPPFLPFVRRTAAGDAHSRAKG